MQISYSVEDRRRAVAEYRRVKSVTKAVRHVHTTNPEKVVSMGRDPSSGGSSVDYRLVS